MTYADLQARQGIDLTPHPANRHPAMFYPCARRKCGHLGSQHLPDCGECGHIGCECRQFVPMMDLATTQEGAQP